jgi:hypothetical protein
MYLSIHSKTAYDHFKNTPRINIIKIYFMLHWQCYTDITGEQGGTRVFYMVIQ